VILHEKVDTHPPLPLAMGAGEGLAIAACFLAADFFFAIRSHPDREKTDF